MEPKQEYPQPAAPKQLDSGALELDEERLDSPTPWKNVAGGPDDNVMALSRDFVVSYECRAGADGMAFQGDKATFFAAIQTMQDLYPEDDIACVIFNPGDTRPGDRVRRLPGGKVIKYRRFDMPRMSPAAPDGVKFDNAAQQQQQKKKKKEEARCLGCAEKGHIIQECPQALPPLPIRMRPV
ncbi:hypothetical protein FDECE_2604 [Fusarium decemcellulare]|nr:hypothetical protein FDECE_2604 [Fusarium decemcellulare]